MTALHTPHLIAPSQVGDGRTVWHETSGDVATVVECLRAYDDRLSLVRNVADNTWEVWRLCEDGEARRIAHRPGARFPNGPSLVRFIAEHDTRRGYDPVADTIAHNDRIDAERAARHDERAEQAADKLALALGRDLDMPAQDGRLYAMGGD